MKTSFASEPLPLLLRALKLPAFGRDHAEIGARAERDGWTFEQFLRHLAELELVERKDRRIARNLAASELPMEKTLATLNTARLPEKVRRQLPALCEGGFVERAENLLAFGRIRCTNRWSRRVTVEVRSRAWTQRDQPDDCCSVAASGGGGTVSGPSSISSSAGTRRARVAAQYFGVSSR